MWSKVPEPPSKRSMSEHQQLCPVSGLDFGSIKKKMSWITTCNPSSSFNFTLFFPLYYTTILFNFGLFCVTFTETKVHPHDRQDTFMSTGSNSPVCWSHVRGGHAWWTTPAYILCVITWCMYVYSQHWVTAPEVVRSLYSLYMLWVPLRES